MRLPPVKALILYSERDAFSPQLIDAGADVTLPAGTDGAGRVSDIRAVNDGRYELRELRPSDRLRGWARRRARFIHGPYGLAQVWLAQELIASADSADHEATRLDAEESLYLDALARWKARQG
ncbi:hypothetical protein [Halotalea alkalilenta]|uniref:Uncharacterized protein n=1 Tax=Halotalea alkalilenta TaxID=376489 RepID=A0A172YC91_9GAMM|nr:hypothetical protein [Halotalea alkalilenta]ANF56838.1 hypothetical protein A5892_04615 [Halotalea alkalilenta]